MADTPQADITRFRFIEINDVVATNAAAPTDGMAGTAPDLVVGPFAPSKMPTTGMLMMLKQPVSAGAATPGAGGFNITVWFRDPGSYRWASFATVAVSYDQLFTTFDVDCGELYFQIGNVAVDGAMDIGIAEQ